MNKNYIATVILATSALSAPLSASDVLIQERPHKIYHVIKHKTLTQAANQIANRTGISFRINAANQSDVISKKLAAEDWKTALAQLLQGYNYTTVLAKDSIKTIIITGHNGSGKSTDTLVNIQAKLSNHLPEKYKNFNAGSVMPVNLPLAQLKSTPVGKKLTLDLPIGQYNINHDNFVKHGDGSSTWIGYLDEEGKGYRFYLSEGKSGIMGNIYTPDGVYNIESENGQTVLVDLERSGLETAGYDHDQLSIPTNPLTSFGFSTSHVGSTANAANTAAATLSTSTSTTSATTATSSSTTGPVVDLMVVYTAAKQTATYAKQRIQYLVDISNQAYKDSKINMRLRLVHTRRTSYSESNSNDRALNDLANDKGALYGTASLRNKYGADLVMLFRPLYARTSNGCGLTYVGFSNGSGANAKYGYGTISNGYSKDSLKSNYCDTSTFTHEIGHSFGNVHDREYSGFAGKYSFSYAWGIDGKFGTIMSYKSPSLMLFSTPKLKTQCKGGPCGYAEGSYRSSDQSRTINNTAASIANYRPKKVTKPVIQ